MTFGSYKEIEYSIVQSINPMGWRWTIQISCERDQTGFALTQHDAKVAGFRAIDQVTTPPCYRDLDLRHYYVSRG